MALPMPTALSPSKVSAFTDCALAFRFSAIDHLPEPPAPAAVKGTLVHLALQHLLDRPVEERTLDNALADLARATEEMRYEREFVEMALSEDDEAKFLADADSLVRRYFEVEDPKEVHPVGLELKLTASVDGVQVRGIIDRLELDADGGLVVTDYKTGRSPGVNYQHGRLSGVTFYAWMCEEVFGVLPSRVQLLFLGDGVTVSTVPTEQQIRGLKSRVRGLWQAIELACEREDFRPKPGPLCDWCNFREFCPAQGGDISLVAKP